MKPKPITPTKKPRSVVLDWDNTLVDTTKMCLEALNSTLTHFCLPKISAEKFFNDPHLSTKDSFPSMFGKHAEEADHIFSKTLVEQHAHGLRPLPGSERLLSFLASENIYTAVVSNKNGHVLRKEIDHLGWQHFFKTTVGSRDTQEDKPSPIPLLTALRHEKDIEREQHWFVGDSDVDILCAHNAGCMPVALGDGVTITHIPFLHCKSCFDLLNILLKF